MMLKRILAAIFLYLVVFPAKAQIRYCLSYTDFQENNWVELDTLFIKHHSRRRQILIGGGEYKLTTGNKPTDKILRIEAFIVEYHDTLFVNCEKLQFDDQEYGKGYAVALRFGGKKLCLAGITKEEIRNVGNNSALMGVFGGAIGGSIAASDNNKALQEQKCYVTKIELRSGQVKLEMVNDAFMQLYLLERTDLLEEYHKLSAKERLRASNILPIFRRAGFVQY